MKTIIIDDEKLALDSLQIDLENHCPEIEIIAQSDDPEDAIQLIDKLHPDLVITDIQMPTMNAFTMLSKLQFQNFELIFVTAFDQYALKAFEFSAVDYLVKPIDYKQLQQAIGKVISNKKMKTIEEKLNLIIHNIKFGQNDNYTLAIPTNSGIEFVEIKDIIYLEANINYCTLYFTDGTKLLVSKPLKHFDQILTDYNFLRIHRSYLVNILFIKSYNKGKSGSLKLKNGMVLPISQSHKSKVQEYLVNMYKL